MKIISIKEIFNLSLLKEGYFTAQVRDIYVENGLMYQIGFDESFFKDNLLRWKTNKGWIYNSECRNPSTNRKLDGHLFFTEKFIKEYSKEIYKLYCEANTKRVSVSDIDNFIEKLLKLNS